MAAEEERRRREAALCEAVEQLADVADVDRRRAPSWRACADAWQALDVDRRRAPSTGSRAASRARRSAPSRAASARPKRPPNARAARAEAIATRDALCARVETLDGDDVLAQLVPIEEEWRSLLPLVGNGPEADRLAERFARAVAACRKRHELGAVLAETRATLEALVVEAEGLPSHDDAAAAAARWQALSREARGHAATL